MKPLAKKNKKTNKKGLVAINFRVTPATRKRVEQYAAKKGLSISMATRKLLEESMNDEVY